VVGVMREAGGFKMGPFELTDMIGHDVNFAVSRSVWSAYFNDPRFLPSLIRMAPSSAVAPAPTVAASGSARRSTPSR